jgi:predicted phage terminase large subunit-like protein
MSNRPKRINGTIDSHIQSISPKDRPRRGEASPVKNDPPSNVVVVDNKGATGDLITSPKEVIRVPSSRVEIIRPQEKQEQFLRNPADITIYGGSAGGGKTWALIAQPILHIGNPLFRSVTFRRSYPEIKQTGGLWEESEKLYNLISGAYPIEGKLQWIFPTGALIRFGHLQNEAALRKWQGSQIPLICFDELTHFSESMFFYMMSRNRSTIGIRPYIRATTNPDPDSWVARFLEWWIDQKTGFAIAERAGKIRWFTRINNKLIWANRRQDLIDQYQTDKTPIIPKSVSFVPASVYDNEILLTQDPQYLANLLALPPVDRAILLDGNWKARPEAGKVFNRTWFDRNIVDFIPRGGIEIIFWDFAATEKQFNKPDPDYTAGVSIRYVQGRYYVTGCWARQLSPNDTEEFYVNTTNGWAANAQSSGATVFVRFELEPGSAAKRDAARMIARLGRYDVAATPSTGDKFLRARPFASQAQAGNVSILRGAWNEEFLDHLHNQPETAHDDIMDAAAGAYNGIQTYISNRNQVPQSTSMQTY